MTLNYLWYKEFIELEGGLVLLGDNKSCAITEVVTLRFHLHNGTKKVLEKDRFEPSLKYNLISLCVLKKNEYVFKGEKGLLKMVRKNDMFTLEGVVVSRLNVYC